jgi:hypothetical protein
MTAVITHTTVNNAPADPTAEVDSTAWNEEHAITGAMSPSQGGTGVANNDASTITITGSFGLTFTLSATTSLTLPTTGTLPTTSSKLSAFAATTSAELAGVISDETGTGALVFGTSPSLTTPELGVATGTSLALSGAAIGAHKLAVTGTSAFSDVMLIGGGSQHINAKLDVTGATVTTGNDSFPFFVSANAPQGQTGFLLYNSASNHVDNKVLFGLQADTTAGRNTAFSFSAKFSDVTDATRTSTVSMLAANNGSTTTAASLVGINWSYPGIITVGSTTATPAGGSTAVRLVFGTTSGFGIYVGSGAPTVSAAQGSLYLRSDGSSTSTRLYVNTNGSTTWTNVTTAT